MPATWRVCETSENIAHLASDCGKYGRAGHDVRKNSKATNNTGGGGSDYVMYSKTIDRAIILSSKWAGPD